MGAATVTVYRIQRSYARKLWRPRDGWRWPPPRLTQLLHRARCTLAGHPWGPWRIDDMEGPGEHLGEGAFMPYCSRESREGEFGQRVCGRACGAVETRWPL